MLANLTEGNRYSGRVLVVDDDRVLLNNVARLLEMNGFDTATFSGGDLALQALSSGRDPTDVVLSDLKMPGMDGLELLRRVRASWPDVAVLVMTGDATVTTAVEAMHLGAYDYLVKPFSTPDDVVLRVSRAVERKRLIERNRLLERQLEIEDRYAGIVGSSRAMRDVFQLIDSVAPTEATVLLLGESGTGKELTARAIHARSRRRERPFIALNCSALPDPLLESELFGHVRGAFTGASANRIGLFEEASGGTLFLDEIGDMSIAMQTRLLRALQEGEIKPVGSSEFRRVDVRVIAATHRHLLEAVHAEKFREDLFYRLNVVSIEVPPLRRRQEDIPLLVHHFLRKHSERHLKPVRRIAIEALQLLQSYYWPGNVRELENAVQRAVVLAKGDVLTSETLPLALQPDPPLEERDPDSVNSFAEAKQVAVESFERIYIEDLLRRTQGRLAEAARLSGLDKSNFRRLALRHGIDPVRFRRAHLKRQ